MTPPKALFGICSLAAGEMRCIDASEAEPVALEVLSGQVDTEALGVLSAGEKVDVTAPDTITATVDAMVQVVDQDEEE